MLKKLGLTRWVHPETIVGAIFDENQVADEYDVRSLRDDGMNIELGDTYSTLSLYLDSGNILSINRPLEIRDGITLLDSLTEWDGEHV